MHLGVFALQSDYYSMEVCQVYAYVPHVKDDT